jgi:hypothetical protein
MMQPLLQSVSSLALPLPFYTCCFHHENVTAPDMTTIAKITRPNQRKGAQSI